MIRNTDAARILSDLRMAVDHRRPVTIDYVKADGTRTVRVIEPYEIVPEDGTRKGHALVRAMDRQSRSIRSFRLERVYAYRVAPARGRFQVPRPVPVPPAPVLPEGWRVVTGPLPHVPEGDWPDAARTVPVVDDIDAEWADWNELTHDPDAPVPYLQSAVNKLKDQEEGI